MAVIVTAACSVIFKSDIRISILYIFLCREESHTDLVINKLYFALTNNLVFNFSYVWLSEWITMLPGNQVTTKYTRR